MDEPKKEKSDIVRLFCHGVEELITVSNIEDLIGIIAVAQTNEQLRKIFDEN